MTIGDVALFGVVGWLALHQVLIRVPALEGSKAAFLLIQITNLTVISGLLSVGVPSLSGDLKVFNWIIALLLVVHTWQNTARYGELRRARLKNQVDADAARRAAVTAALAAGEAAGDAPPAEPPPSA